MLTQFTLCEQELFQDYQFLDPESEYEVSVKVGPASNAKEAKVIVEDWKRQIRERFDAKTWVVCCVVIWTRGIDSLTLYGVLQLLI